MKRIIVLGSTGSIGTQTLDVARQLPERIQVVGLAANRDGESLLAQSAGLGGVPTVLFDQEAASKFGTPGGMDAVVGLVQSSEADLVVIAVAGVIGLIPTLAALEAGKDVALASKEVLVAAGGLVTDLARARGRTLTPIDSEHSAVFQCLQGAGPSQVRRIVITASGGPFRGKKQTDLAKVTPVEALNHPTWSMGGKITVDSATLMNKGLETIEALWLFDLKLDQVDVLVHPQSIVHSFVEFNDTSVVAQLGWPDMRLPIQYALLYPERVKNSLRPWDPLQTAPLTFEAVDHDSFPSLMLARSAFETGGTAPCALNAANEEAANAFLRGECSYLGIARTVEAVLERHKPVEASLESVMETDAWARVAAREIYNKN
ncbi:MAG: 1-deoxy-D-xylulose-5-phosphate reductoisomerase [Fimbriimonadaceae bacterium]|nr:1-deoxy-D-xylulose-5-phosphate reductoisomerase [Fimbriimonadaceae bacterium]QYK59235.1 MAG: 1-deoxy-D-xylulose-5-phosphate reductoisomerase [Fimbriimonadaceae bacterium]